MNSESDSQLILNQIVLEHLRDKKRKRFWRIIKAIVISLLLLFAVYYVFLGEGNANRRAQAHVGLIDIKGGIFDSQGGGAENFSKGLHQAYENKQMKALILRIDSPGGSPVQADYMYNNIQYYRKKYPAIKIYAVCVDACASAAYYVAAAADEIYAAPASLVGSIGVIYSGFGFVDTMQKLGVSRRLMTAGRNKGFMDQFSPESEDQKKDLQTMLDLIHQQFIDRVKAGRGKRLRIDEDTFSGLFWTGQQAKERGLIDGFASSGQLARDIIKINQVINYTKQQNVLDRMAKQIGMAMAEQLPLSLGIKQGIHS